VVGKVCGTHGEKRNAHMTFVGRPERKRPLGRPRHRCENNTKVDLREIGWGVWTGFIWFGIGASGVLW
jgi:hypothetical protein